MPRVLPNVKARGGKGVTAHFNPCIEFGEMTRMPPPIQPLISRKATGLKGRIRVPGDKSMSHRALMLGAVAIGETRIRACSKPKTWSIRPRP